MRKSFALGLAFCLVWALIWNGQAAPPPNDRCEGAELIDLSNPYPALSTITTNLHEATTDGDPPQPTNCYAGPVSRSVWYKFQPTIPGLYTVSLKWTGTTLQDPLLGMYTSPADCAGPFEQFACNDDVGNLQPAITTNLNAGTTYYVVVWHALTNAPAENQRSVQLKVAKIEPTPNDLCANAVEIPSVPYLTPVQNSHLATSTGDPTLPCTNGQRSVWYKFRPTEGGNYIISTCTNSTKTTIFHSALAIYTSSSGDCSGTLTPEACNAGFCGTSAAVIHSLTPGVQYYIVVWDVETEAIPDETEIQLYVLRQGPPDTRTVGVVGVTPTSVTLSGAANPKGLLTRGYFEWGDTPSFGNVTANSTLGTGVTDFPYTRLVSGLRPGSTIHFRAAANNSLGTTFGQAMSITLPLQPPRIDSLTLDPSGWLIMFTAADDFTHYVEMSEDLVTWTQIGVAVWLGDGLYQYLDEGPFNGGQRFYRIKL